MFWGNVKYFPNLARFQGTMIPYRRGSACRAMPQRRLFWEGLMPESMSSSSIAIGDLFESDGRRRTFWAVETITYVPRKGTIIRLAEIDGTGRLNIPAVDLDILSDFRRLKRNDAGPSLSLIE